MNEHVNLPSFANCVTRRQAMAGLALAAGGMALGPIAAWADAGADVSHDAEAIHQEPFFKAGRKRVYEALTETKSFDKIVQLSGAVAAMGLGSKPTQITNKVGGAFELFGGYVTGLQIELVPDERIVQVWRAGSWKQGFYSIAKFVLQENGAGTRIIFDHTGFPKGAGEHLASGWKSNYWEPLEKFLAS